MTRIKSSHLRSRLCTPVVLAAVLLLASCAAVPSETPSVEDGGRSVLDQPSEGPQTNEPAAETTAAEPIEQETDAGDLDCTTLDELTCLGSGDCTLRQREDKTYACTAAASDCERGFLQSVGQEETCPDGCRYSPAQCYCSPDVTCVCGGGPPALCEAAA